MQIHVPIELNVATLSWLNIHENVTSTIHKKTLILWLYDCVIY